LEAVISDSFDTGGSDGPPLIMAPPEAGETLRSSGFDVVNIDNNHILDHGAEAVRETKAHLDDAGIEYVGSPLGEERPTTLSRGETPIHLVGFNLCEEGQTSDREDVMAMARELGARDGLSILSLHWGWRKVHMLTPSAEQINLGHAVADAGVDVVLGHHSHTFQPVEHVDESVVGYSLGNFVFDMWRPDNAESGILEVAFDANATDDPDLSVTPVRTRAGRVQQAEIPRIERAVPSEPPTVAPATTPNEHSRHVEPMIKKSSRSTRETPLACRSATTCRRSMDGLTWHWQSSGSS